MKNLESKSESGQKTEGRNGAWASLASMEGINTTTRQWYLFAYRNEVLSIGRESDGEGGERFVFNHPTEWDLKNNRTKRVRRNSKVVIEMEARKAVDEKLDNEVRLTREKYQALEKQLHRLHRIEEVVAPVGLSLEIFLDRLVQSLPHLPPKISPAELVEIGIERFTEMATDITATTPSEIPGSFATTDISGQGPASSTISSNPALSKAAEAQETNPATATPVQIGSGAQASAQVCYDPKSAAPESGHKRRRRRIKVQWPSKPDFLEMLWHKRGTQIARDLGCWASTVLAKADELGLPRPEPFYWITKKFGEPVEIPESIKILITHLRLEAQETACGVPPQELMCKG
jgi:hypothetical protein